MGWEKLSCPVCANARRSALKGQGFELCAAFSRALSSGGRSFPCSAQLSIPLRSPSRAPPFAPPAAQVRVLLNSAHGSRRRHCAKVGWKEWKGGTNYLFLFLFCWGGGITKLGTWL